MSLDTSRVLILGDIHADWETANILLDHIPRTEYDEIIQVGDMGAWIGYIAPWMRSFDCRTRWVDGNHEHHPRILKRDQHFGETADTHWVPMWQAFFEQWEYKPRGHIEEGILFIGGARSIDKHVRIKGRDWFPEENILASQREFIRSNIAAYGPENIHTVIAHDCPESFPVLDAVIARNGGAVLGYDPNRPFLQEIFEEVKPERWYFGHYHIPWKATVKGCEARCVSLVNDWDYAIVELPCS